MANVEIKEIFRQLIRHLKRLENINNSRVTLTATSSVLVSGWVMDEISATLHKNILTVYINFHKTSTQAYGNITNVSPFKITVTHGGRIRGTLNVTQGSGSNGPLTSLQMVSTSTGDTTLTFNVCINSIGRSSSATAMAANTKINSMFVIPVTLNTSKF